MSHVKYTQTPEGWNFSFTANGTTAKGEGFPDQDKARESVKELRRELSKIARANFKHRKEKLI